METDINRPKTPRLRQIGSIGTMARVILGLLLLADGLVGGHVSVIIGEVLGLSPRRE